MDFATADAIRQGILAGNDTITAAVLLGERLVTDPDFYAALHGREIAPGIHIQNPGPDPARTAEKLVRRAQGAASDYVAGMQNPKRDPVQAAIRAKGKYADKVQEAIRNDSYARGVGKQNYAEAVQIATGDGGSAYTSGVSKRVAKIQRVHQDLMPRLGAVSQSIQQMPQDSDGQREARLLAARRAMIAVGKARKGISGSIGGGV
jgi:hypothetical protein